MTTNSPATFRTAPSLKALPIAWHVFDAWRDPIGILMQTMREHGDVALLRLGPSLRFYLVNDVGSIHQVLQENAKNYKKSRNYEGLKFVLGDGLLTSEGEFWKRQRRLAQPAFHPQRLPAFAETMAKLTASHLDGIARSAGVVDVHAAMMRLTFRIVGQTLFGTDVENEARPIGDALTTALEWAQKYADSILRLPPWVPTPTNVRFRRAMATLDRLVFRIVEQRRSSAVEGKDLLGMLMAVRGDGGEAMSDKQLRDEIMTVVLAGHETTANAMAFALHLLAHHPAVERRLRSEVEEVLSGRAPSFDDLPKLAFTERVVLEAMRLYPPAWCFEREAIHDDELGGFHVPAGSIVGICPYTLHRYAKYWDDPERFDPDRFLPERSEKRPQKAYLPFGDGPRVCIGRAFAMMEAKIILALFVQRFRLESTSADPIATVPGITLRPKDGVRLRLEPTR